MSETMISQTTPFIRMLPVPSAPEGGEVLAAETPLTNAAWDTVATLLQERLERAESFEEAAREFGVGAGSPEETQLVNELMWMIPLILERQEKFFEMPQHPKVEISWFDCVIFCNLLSRFDGYDYVYNIEFERTENGPNDYTLSISNVTIRDGARGYCLPTAKLWEHMCRAGTDGDHYGLAKGLELTDIAWFQENCDSAMPVALKEPNDWGFHDTLGNVWEWCWDEE
jgi:formylglycine-generating enzyme required for sulfatase activity